MSGISAVSMIRFVYSNSASFGTEKLTPETKAKLVALGVDISSVKTEREGKMKLREAQMERYFGGETIENTKPKDDTVLIEARELAEKLDILISEHESVDEITDKIAEKLEKMKSAAGEDFDKCADVNYYERQLSQIENAQQSQIDLSASMNLTANMNMAFHGLY